MRFQSALIFALALLALASLASAQTTPGDRRVEITGFGGYRAGGGTSSRLGRLTIDDRFAYGVLVDVRVRPDATIQLVYDRQATALDFRDDDPFSPTGRRVDLSVEYFHFGGTVEFLEDRFRPYFALTVGATRFDALDVPAGDEWRLSVGFGGGFKTYVSDRFGLRVDTRVWPTFVNTSGGFLCSLPGGCLASIEADALWQVGASVGLFIAF